MCLAQGPQRSDAHEARIRGPSVLSQALYHCAPRHLVKHQETLNHDNLTHVLFSELICDLFEMCIQFSLKVALIRDFLAILGRGPRVFPIGKSSVITH